MPEVLGDDFPKGRAGRPVRVDITPIKKMADEMPGQVIGEVLDEADAQSVRRQFLRMPEYKVMTSKHTQNGKRQVMVQRKN